MQFRWLMSFVVAVGVLLQAALPVQAQESYDMLDYLLPDDPSQALSDGGGPHHLDKTIYGNSMFVVKWPTLKGIEYFTWDENNIYLRFDSTLPLAETFDAYEFINGGLWAKRHMRLGESLSQPNARVKMYKFPNCDQVVQEIAMPYTITIESFNPAYDLGGTLGRQPVLILNYNWGPDPEVFERFYYTKKHGWVRHEAWFNGRLEAARSFNTPQATAQKYFPDRSGCSKVPEFWDAELKLQTVPTEVEAGQTFQVQARVRNTSNLVWTKAQLFRLGWSTGRAELPKDTIKPGETAVVTLTLQAPTTVGSYTQELQMLQENVRWFGQKALVQTQVITPVSQPDPTPPTLCQKSDLNQDGSINLFDYTLFVAAYRQQSVTASNDLNGDGLKNLFDYTYFVQAYKTC